jgi:hypothetical protein
MDTKKPRFERLVMFKRNRQARIEAVIRRLRRGQLGRCDIMAWAKCSTARFQLATSGRSGRGKLPWSAGSGAEVLGCLAGDGNTAGGRSFCSGRYGEVDVARILLKVAERLQWQDQSRVKMMARVLEFAARTAAVSLPTPRNQPQSLRAQQRFLLPAEGLLLLEGLQAFAR